jgi:hypothetical protein
MGLIESIIQGAFFRFSCIPGTSKLPVGQGVRKSFLALEAIQKAIVRLIISEPLICPTRVSLISQKRFFSKYFKMCAISFLFVCFVGEKKDVKPALLLGAGLRHGDCSF